MMASMDAQGLKRVAATMARLERPADRAAFERLLADRLGAYFDGSDEIAALTREIWTPQAQKRRRKRDARSH